jgi:hypothetical protein
MSSSSTKAQTEARESFLDFDTDDSSSFVNASGKGNDVTLSPSKTENSEFPVNLFLFTTSSVKNAEFLNVGSEDGSKEAKEKEESASRRRDTSSFVSTSSFRRAAGRAPRAGNGLKIGGREKRGDDKFAEMQRLMGADDDDDDGDAGGYEYFGGEDPAGTYYHETDDMFFFFSSISSTRSLRT